MEDFARPVSSVSVFKVELLQDVAVLLVAPLDVKWAELVTSPTSSLFLFPFFHHSPFTSVFGLSMPSIDGLFLLSTFIPFK